MNLRLSEILQQFRHGEISRRDFVQAAALLGLGLGAAELLASCVPTATTTPTSDVMLHFEGFDTVPTYALNHIHPEGTNTPPPEKEATTWYCSACGQRFATLEAFQKHALAEHVWKLPEILQVEEPTYRKGLVGVVKRFDEKNTIFSRLAWDEDLQKLEAAAAQAKEISGGGVDTIEGEALVAGAIYVDKTAGNQHPYYPGYFGHMREVGGLYNWDDPVNSEQYSVSDPAVMSDRIKEVARFYGADLVGITTIDPLWVYENYFEPITGKADRLNIDNKYAIVMGIEMDWNTIDDTPGPNASAATALAYSKMAEVSASLAKYIRSLGYPAIPCGNDTTQSIPLAIDAGLGELGRLGLMLSPEFGPRQRLCKVLTDLPLVPDKPIDFGIQSYCETCHACCQACPADAIRWEDRTTEGTSISNRPGILRWPVDVEKCHLFWTENGYDCSNCVAACPWALQPRRMTEF
jgi:epoxyqueuosine reductase